MSTPFFDDAARDLFDEIFRESLAEFREEKASTPPEPSAPEPETPPEPPQTPAESPAEPVPVPRPRTPSERLHRAMYVLDMHKGRPHSDGVEFQRRWLEEALRAVVLMLAELPEGRCP
jgi:hypothetical protein